MQKTVKLVKQKLPLLDTEIKKALKDFVQNGKENLKDFLENDLEIHIPKKVKNYQKFVSFLIRNKRILEGKSNRLKEYVRNNQWDYVKFVVQLLDLKPMDYGVSGLTFCDKVLICEYVSEVSTVTEDDTLDHYFNAKFPSENKTDDNIFKKANVTDLVGNLLNSLPAKNGSTDFFDLKKDDFIDGFTTTMSPVDEEGNATYSVPETTENEGIKINTTIRFPQLEEQSKLPLDSTLFDDLKEVFTKNENENFSNFSSMTKGKVPLDSPFFNNLTEALNDDEDEVDFLQHVFQIEDDLLTMNETTSKPSSSPSTTEAPFDQFLADFEDNINSPKNGSIDFKDLGKDDFSDDFITTLSPVVEESSATHSVPKTIENEGIKNNATIQVPNLDKTDDFKADTWTIESENESIGNIQFQVTFYKIQSEFYSTYQ